MEGRRDRDNMSNSTPDHAVVSTSASPAGTSSCVSGNGAHQRVDKLCCRCDYCCDKKISCDGDAFKGVPCRSCVRAQIDCVFGFKKKAGPKSRWPKQLGLEIKANSQDKRTSRVLRMCALMQQTRLVFQSIGDDAPDGASVHGPPSNGGSFFQVDVEEISLPTAEDLIAGWTGRVQRWKAVPSATQRNNTSAITDGGNPQRQTQSGQKGVGHQEGNEPSDGRQSQGIAAESSLPPGPARETFPSETVSPSSADSNDEALRSSCPDPYPLFCRGKERSAVVSEANRRVVETVAEFDSWDCAFSAQRVPHSSFRQLSTPRSDGPQQMSAEVHYMPLEASQEPGKRTTCDRCAVMKTKCSGPNEERNMCLKCSRKGGDVACTFKLKKRPGPKPVERGQKRKFSSALQEHLAAVEAGSRLKEAIAEAGRDV